MSAWLPILDGAKFIMEACTFIQFIQEEAIQSCQLGCFLAFRAKNYKAVSMAMTTTRGVLLPHLRLVNEELGWMAPYSRPAFADFILATEVVLEVYDQLLLSALK